MSTYRERREAKADRLREWADKRDARARTDQERADQLAAMIPFGQPILAGHHSERRHRNDLDRINRGHERAWESQRKADDFRRRADGIENAAGRAIYRDDPDAIEALEQRIAELEAERARIKAYNASCRKGQRDTSLLDDRQQADLINIARVAAYQIRADGSAPAYWSANLSGNIKRNRDRLAVLRRQAGDEPDEATS